MASASICRINICRITFIVKNMILVSTTIPVRTGFRIYCPYKLRSSSVQERRKKIFILKWCRNALLKGPSFTTRFTFLIAKLFDFISYVVLCLHTYFSLARNVLYVVFAKCQSYSNYVLIWCPYLVFIHHLFIVCFQHTPLFNTGGVQYTCCMHYPIIILSISIYKFNS